MKVALYVRVSTQDQASEGYSIEQQKEALLKYCEARGWKAQRVFCDAGFSGSNVDRPALQEMILSICEFDTVLVYKLDRLSRSQKDTLWLFEDVFEANGVSFTSLCESFDTTSAFGKATIGILSVFAQLEREQIKERMAMGRLGRVKSGKTSAWVVAPFGYNYIGGELIQDPIAAKIVKSIYEHFIAGESISSIVKNLNNAGHICKERPWSYRTVKSVLMNAVYTGISNFRGEQYQGNHAPILSGDLFTQAQAEFERRSQSKKNSFNKNPEPFERKHLLSGMLECGYCGSGFKLVKGRERKNGTCSRNYECTMKRAADDTHCAHEKCKTPKTKTRNICRYFVDELERKVINKLKRERLDLEKHPYEKRAEKLRLLVDKIIIKGNRIQIRWK